MTPSLPLAHSLADKDDAMCPVKMLLSDGELFVAVAYEGGDWKMGMDMKLTDFTGVMK